jgi:hypothetical protein
MSAWRRATIKRPLTRMPDEEMIYRSQLSRTLPAGTDTASMIALNRTLYERARDMGDVQRGRDVAGRLEAPLRTCLADCRGGEDEVRPEERADTGSRDVSQLRRERSSPPQPSFVTAVLPFSMRACWVDRSNESLRGRVGNFSARLPAAAANVRFRGAKRT